MVNGAVNPTRVMLRRLLSRLILKVLFHAEIGQVPQSEVLRQVNVKLVKMGMEHASG